MNNPLEFFAQVFGERGVADFDMNMPPEFRFFTNEAQAQAFAAAAQQAAQQGQPPASRPNPPASCKAIRQLPTVTVTPEDLVDENNRECCICFEPHNIGDRVTRLPCAHIFHPRCIIPWLGSHSNTCPICRYELSTDDVEFEQGREERMKQRKPRYAKYELERMSVKELKELARKLKLSPPIEDSFLEKKEVVDTILNSGKVIVMAAPEPIEYPSIRVLREMKIRQLKAAMAEAGVFFDPKDVVEKEDMVQIFINSGRIILTGEGEEDADVDESHGASDDYGHAPRREESDTRLRYQFSEEEATTEGDDTGMEKKRARIEDDSDSSHSTRSLRLRNSSSQSLSASASASPHDDVAKMEYEHEDGHLQPNSDREDATVPSSARTEGASPITSSTASTDEATRSVPLTSTAGATTPLEDVNSNTTNYTETNAGDPINHGIMNRSVKELRQLAQELSVDLSGCLEKREMIDLIVSAVQRRRSNRSSSR